MVANSGVSILQPYSCERREISWFMYQPCDLSKYIDSINPEYALILSGDHIYKMDYDDMLQFKDNNASLTKRCPDVCLPAQLQPFWYHEYRC